MASQCQSQAPTTRCKARLCGGVQFEMTAPFVWASHCHCSRCREHSGAFGVTQGRVSARGLSADPGRGADHRLPPEDGRVKAFCKVCGSSLFGNDWPEGDQIGVRLGALDGIRASGRSSTRSSPRRRPGKSCRTTGCPGTTRPRPSGTRQGHATACALRTLLAPAELRPRRANSYGHDVPRLVSERPAHAADGVFRRPPPRCPERGSSGSRIVPAVLLLEPARTSNADAGARALPLRLVERMVRASTAARSGDPLDEAHPRLWIATPFGDSTHQAENRPWPCSWPGSRSRAP